MSSLQLYYNTNDDDSRPMDNDDFVAQTFTPTEKIVVTSVKIKAYKVTTPNTFTLGLYATTDGKPSGSVITSGTYNGNNMTTDSGGAWYEITLGAAATLLSGTMYAIRGHCASPGASSFVRWRLDSSSPTLANGTVVRSSDGGSNWTVTATEDAMFELWGSKKNFPKVMFIS